MIPILGFAPDTDQTTPGVLSNCNNLIPYNNGMEGAPTPVGVSSLQDDSTEYIPALAAPCLGAVMAMLLDGTNRIIAGTAENIYEQNTSGWVSVGDVGGYNGGATTRWSFAVFGNTIIASNLADDMQESSGADFAAIGGSAPKAKIVFSVREQVMALHVNDGSLKTNGWHCCAVFDSTDWAQDTATQANSGLLVATPGAITAGGAMGDYAVAYKEKSVYLGQYVGAPVVWDWIAMQTVKAGCVGQDAWCDIGGQHFFVDSDNFYILSPSGAVPIGDGVIKEWFSQNVNRLYLYTTQCFYDVVNSRVWVFYPSSGSTSPDKALVWHVKTNKWGRVNLSIQAVMYYIGKGWTINSLNSLAATIGALPDIPYNSSYWGGGNPILCVFDTTNTLKGLSGACNSSSLTTGDVGDDESVSTLKEVRLRYATAPSSASVRTYHKMNSGVSYSDGSTGDMDDGKFDVLQSARWHKAKVTFHGDVKITHMGAKSSPAGKR